MPGDPPFITDRPAGSWTAPSNVTIYPYALRMKSLSTLGCAVIAAALTLCPLIASAAPSPDVDAVRQTIHERFPDLKIQDVRSAPLPGWYEVFTGTQLAYSDATGDHLFVGKLLDTKTKKDLAAEELQNRMVIDFQKLPFERAIKIVKGDGSRRLALFEDPDCPYCQAFEHELANISNVTLYVFLFPITELHPEARIHAHEIWCAPNRGDAWTHWMLEHKVPGSADCKEDPIDQLQKVGTDLNVTGTPTFFLANGKRVEGTLGASKLEELLSPQAGDAAAASNGAKSTGSGGATERVGAAKASSSSSHTGSGS
jgi:thiol:disulfide interchange protein DsbC